MKVELFFRASGAQWLKFTVLCGDLLFAAISLPRTARILKKSGVHWAFSTSEIIPTRCRELHLKQFCLEYIAPAILIILITHIILAIRWMLIKILSVVINRHMEYTVIVVIRLGVL